MAEHTKLHLWLNTVVAVAAFGASAGSVVFAWKSYELRSESLGFTVNPTYECPLEFRTFGDDGFLSLCWIVTVTNQSETRTSIVRYQSFDVTGGGRAFRSGFPAVENEKGQPIPPPITLDGGDARTFLMRVSFVVPSDVASLAKGLPENASLHNLQSLTLKANFNIIGNKVDVKFYDEKKLQAAVMWRSDMKVALGEIRFFTGRGNMFPARMSFPPILHAD